jgi:N-acetylglucosaminyldiphosphoundecaprenol N-acetyl-beta-D-mannosaminyltransferase
MDSCTQVLALRVHPTTLRGAVETLQTLVDQRRSAAVHLCNAWNAVLATNDAAYAQTLNAGVPDAATLNLTDGMSLVWAGRVLGAPAGSERVPGARLMLAACEAGLDRGVRHYFYGGGQGVADELAASLTQRFPGLQVAGTEMPPFRPLSGPELAALAERVAASRADLVWVGLGTPKQDYFIASLKPLVQVGALLAVGAAFDFLSGRKAMAPAWMQRSGLEWAHRFASEPRRLWRRYLIGNAVFTFRLAQQVIRERRQHRRSIPA